MTKFIHTGDWHLGKKLFQESRINDQSQFLDNLLALIEKNKTDCLLVAGDIFDTPNPPHEAQALFYSFLSKLDKSKLRKAIFIGGNHDGQQFLKIPTPLLNSDKIHIITNIEKDYRSNTIEIDDIAIYALPFFKSIELEKFKNNPEQDSLEALQAHLKKVQTKKKQILLAHHNFGKYTSTGSEHFISINGIESINAKELINFDYLALGHIHKRQTISTQPLSIYPGSPYPLRFSESNKKYIVELNIGDKVEHEFIELSQNRLLKSIQIDKEDIDKHLEYFKQCSDDYLIEVTYYLDKDTYQLIDQFISNTDKRHKVISQKKYYKNSSVQTQKNHHLIKSVPELFLEFYQKSTNEELQKDSIVYKEFLDLIQRAELNENT